MRRRVLVALVGVMVAVAGCSSTVTAPAPDYNRPPRSPGPVFGGAPTLPPPDLTNDGRGSVVEVRPLVDSAVFDIVNATAVRMVYRSATGDGDVTEVTGVVAVPPGTPPRGGWPIISFGHTVTGLDYRCAPSNAEDLGGYAGTIASLIQRGYVVAMSDYQGLGVERTQPHSIVDGETLGRNVIDAARAARRVLPSASNRWIAFGTGEGGLASWAAAELATAGDGGMELVGAVALSPFADLSGLAPAAQQGKLTKEQNPLYMQAVTSLASTGADIDVNAYRSGVAAQRWDLMINCGEPAERKRALEEVRPADLRPADQAAADALQAALAAAALPIESVPPATAPILVIYGSEDPLVAAGWIERTVAAACRKGDPVQVMERIGDSSGTNYITIQMAMNWVQSRLDGQRAETCGGTR